MRALKYQGICKNELWPEDPNIIPSKEQKWKADEDAYNRRIASYQRCLTLDDVKFAITKGEAVGIRFPLYESYTVASDNGIFPIPKAFERIVDDHAVAINGYTDNLSYVYKDGVVGQGFFRVVNSWGPDWGDNGYGYLPYKYVNQYAKELLCSLGYRLIELTTQEFKKAIIEQISLEKWIK